MLLNQQLVRIQSRIQVVVPLHASQYGEAGNGLHFAVYPCAVCVLTARGIAELANGRLHMAVLSPTDDIVTIALALTAVVPIDTSQYDVMKYGLVREESEGTIANDVFNRALHRHG